MSTAPKLIFVLGKKSLPRTREERIEVLNDVAKKQALIQQKDLEVLIAESIPANVTLYCREGFEFSKYCPSVWKVKKSTPPQI